MAEFEVKGLRELQAAMNKLRVDMANKIARQATAAGAAVVRKAARDRAGSDEIKDTGNLQAAIVMKRVRGTSLTEEYIVTVRRGKKSDVRKAKSGKGPLGRDAYYARFVEFGTVKTSARPFIAPALAENIDPATEAMKKRLAARLKKAGAL